MNFHPIQLNFGSLVNNSTLSDITLKATVFDETKSIDDNNDDNKDDNKFNESNMSLMSSLDEDDSDSDINDNDNDNDDNNNDHIKRSKDGTIFCHWDILRARCIVFDLIFHAMIENKVNRIPSNCIHIDMESNIIHFDVCYDALFIVVKYLYTGLIRRYDYNEIRIARDVVQLANLLNLDQLRVDINGQFLCSRKRLKDDQLNNDNDKLGEWRSVKFESFNISNWDKKNKKHFLNINVLYDYDDNKYKNVSSRQLIKINNRIFEISKIIFVSVSQYFKAMFCKSIWKESQHNVSGDIIEMKQIKADDFEKLQRFLYTFDQTNYYDPENGKLNDYDFNKETESKYSMNKKQLLNDTINAFHLSIFFGIDDLRQCLIFIIDKYYLCKNTLWPFWNLGFEFELKDVKELCSNYFSKDFGNISSDKEIFYSFTKNMIKCGLSNGSIQVSTEHLIQVLLKWAHFHQTSIQELLPPNTLFNEANKSFVLSNRRAMDQNLQHLLRL